MEDTITSGGGRAYSRVAWLCLGALFAISMIVATFLLARTRPLAPVADLMLIYVGAEDCAPCRNWHRGDGATFRSSADFDRLTYREVSSPHLADVLSEENWPQDIRDYKNSIRESDGVPLWLVVADHTVVERQFGADAWRNKILPTIKFYLR